MPQAYTNAKANQILRGLSEWWSIAGNRKAAIARVAYIIRYSIAKVYAAKFKLPTVAAVFKAGGNNLGKSIGTRKKSVVGANYLEEEEDKYKLKGILFDRYHKIPAPKGNKLNPNWKPEYVKYLEKDLDPQQFAKALWADRKSTSKNPLAQMMWRLDKTTSHQGSPCAICGTLYDVQMHHIRALKDIETSKSPIDKHMIAINRKQIPLCRTHHLSIHRGNWRNSPMNVKQTYNEDK
jgi:hypothetical protein